MSVDELFARIEAENPEPIELMLELDPPSFLAFNVMTLRSRRGMTQAQLAAAIGVSQPRIAKIERGDANPRLITLAKLAYALGVTLSELLVDNLCAPARARRAALWEAMQQSEPDGKRQAK